MDSSRKLLRAIPKVDRLLATDELTALADRASPAEVIHVVRSVLEELRQEAREGTLTAAEMELAAVCRRVTETLAHRSRPYYRQVINATGVILHTNLGRAPLAFEAVDALARTAGGSQRLEVDLDSGQRSGRDRGCATILEELTGAEAATVVNNNAAATLLILAAMARGKKVLLSRGELVEIGGSYRIPEIMRESGATLVEVGTTNRTHPRDYRQALDDETALVLKVHTSNYRVEGFTREVEIEELVEIGRERGLPVVHDLGSGCLVDLESRGILGEPRVQRSLEAGAELVCFSGDKLLGGPQSGIVVGRQRAVDRCRNHPLFRALRPGRLVYTALEATLALYREGEDAAMRKVPALARLTASGDELRRRAQRLRRRLSRVPGFECSVVDCMSQAGSGSLPARDLASWGVRALPAFTSAEDLAVRLRSGDPAVVVRIHQDAVLFDARTLADDELPLIERRCREIGLGSIPPSRFDSRP